MEDTRYRLRVTLVAAKRPKYWSWHCPRCGNKVAELSGDVLTISDVADDTVIPDWQPAPFRFRCAHKYCNIWFEFLTLS